MDIKTRLQEVFRDVFDDESIVISEEMSAKDIDAWDSLNHVILILAAEKEFKLSFKTAEISELKNIGDFINLIDSKLESR